MNGSKNAIIKSKVIEIILFTIGSFNLFIFGLCTIIYFLNPDLYDQLGDLLIFIPFDILWIMMIKFGFNRNKLVRRLKQYTSIVGDNSTFSISRLSTISGDSEVNVLKNLKMMMKRKFLKDVSIDMESNTIIFQAVNQKPKAVDKVSSKKEEETEIAVTCKNCGGMNKMKKGSVKECEYCTSLIEG
jgi:hypothetical protein